MLAATVRSLLGVPLRASHISHARVAASQLPELCLQPLVAAVLERDTGRLHERLVVECAPAAAAVFVDMALGGDGSLEFTQGLSPLDDVSCGVLAYVAARLLAESGSSYTLRSLVQDRSELLVALGGDAIHIAALRLELGGRQATLRVMSSGPLTGAIDSRIGAPLDPALLELPIELRAVCGRAALPEREVATLDVDDIVVLDDCSLSDDGGPFQGSVWLCTSRGRRVLSAQACGEQLIIERGAAIDAPPAASPTSTLLASTPAADDFIELSADVACLSLTVGALAALGPGAVLEVGRPIDAIVTLRTPERAIAEGRLLRVEAERGVRVTRLFA